MQPSASQNEWSGSNDGRIRLSVSVLPVDNHANLECVKLIEIILKKRKDKRERGMWKN